MKRAKREKARRSSKQTVATHFALVACLPSVSSSKPVHFPTLPNNQHRPPRTLSPCQPLPLPPPPFHTQPRHVLELAPRVSAFLTLSLPLSLSPEHTGRSATTPAAQPRILILSPSPSLSPTGSTRTQSKSARLTNFSLHPRTHTAIDDTRRSAARSSHSHFLSQHTNRFSRCLRRLDDHRSFTQTHTHSRFLPHNTHPHRSAGGPAPFLVFPGKCFPNTHRIATAGGRCNDKHK
jgi:hypothetical protein